MRFGAQLWAQAVTWPQLRDAALAAEAAGFDDVWTWDHLYAIYGPWEQPSLEGWSVLAGLAPLTSRVRLGLMVGANTFRTVGLTAKLATTLDHLSGGRSILGIGGAWFEREHEAFGIDFGSGFGERLDRLDEAVMLLRRLLDGETIERHDGRFYQLRDALVAPRPVQPHLPILIGGSGPTKTLRTTARYADAWNTSGPEDQVRRSVATLEERCAEVGRDPGEIERTITFCIVVRDRAADAEAAFGRVLAANGTDSGGPMVNLFGPPEAIADGIRPYRDELGFGTVVVRLPAPYDDETIARIGEVREHLG